MSTPANWSPSERTCRWLLFGILAALVEAVLFGASTALEMRDWQEEGLTASAWLGLVASLPQIVLLVTYLRLARDVGARGLWKGAAGFYLCGWLGVLVDLASYETLPAWCRSAITLLGGGAALGLVVFLFWQMARFC